MMKLSYSTKEQLAKGKFFKVKDISYYFKLFKDGAITDKEYQKKKNELLGNESS